MRVLIVVLIFVVVTASCGGGVNLNDDPIGGDCIRPVPPSKVTYLEQCFDCHNNVPAAYK